MKYMHYHRLPTGKEQGVSLFIALIALVLMTLGALALYRSVDTTTAVVGNIGFRERAVALANSGVEDAMTWLTTNSTTLNSNQSSNGYYASKDYGLDLTTAKGDPTKAMQIFDWSKGKLVGNLEGYTVYYVIHRLCALEGAVSGTSCETCGSTAGFSSQTGETKGLGGGGGTANACYRITSRAVGPRNVESIVQTIVK